jgi:hypothetical protein
LNDDDDWQEQAMTDPSSEGSHTAVQLVCYFDSTQELRGRIGECWLDFQAGFEDPQTLVEPRPVAFCRQNTGLRIDIDNGLEITLQLFPVIAGEPREDLPGSVSEVILQLHDDGAGSPDPVQLQELLEWLLEDLLPGVGQIDLECVAERFDGGERPVLLTDITGQLLEMPPGMADFG